MSIRAVIVEDEPLSRQAVRDLVAPEPWLTVVGEAGDGPTAVSLIETLRPDVVFLDVELPEYNGLRVVQQLSKSPAIVFVTAYDQYAISAFELDAIDYLVKPFGTARFAETLRRIRAHFSGSDSSRSSEAGCAAPLSRLFLRKRHDLVPVRITAVSHLAAEGDYTRVFVAGDHYLSQMSLGDFERRLDPERFVRVHRSLIVNLDHVASLHRLDDRRLRIHMANGFETVSSRAGAIRLRNLFT